MSDGSTMTSIDQQLSRGRTLTIALLQIVLIPTLAIVGFGFIFVGAGLSPDSGGAITGRDIAILALYGIVALTVLILLVSAPLLLIARATDRPAMARKTAYIPLGFAALAVLILVGLGIAGFVFEQVPAA